MNFDAVKALEYAFFRDPVVGFLLPVEESRSRPLSIGMEFLLGLSSHTYTLQTPQLACVGAIGAVAPGQYPISLFKLLLLAAKLAVKSLLLGIPSSLVRKWIKIFSEFDKMHPSFPHWYVLVLGVDARNQGKGSGGELLKHILDKADTEKLPVYLESSNSRNLDFYKRHGFEVIDKIIPVTGCPPVWGLLRKAAESPENAAA
jgi:ribosomal protein S18 acetylase RimI-like enzyme